MDSIDQILRSAGHALVAPQAQRLTSYPGAPARQDRAGWDGAGGIQTQGDHWYRDNAGAGGYTYVHGNPMQQLVGDIMAGGHRGSGQQMGCPPGGEGFAPRQAPGAVVAYSPFEATGGRRFPIGGFRATITAAAGGGAVQNQPQLPFRTERLVVPSNIATDFDIVDVKVGQASEFVAAGAIPALVFSEQGFDVGLRGDTAYIAMTISIQVQLLAGVDKDFSAAIIGTVVRGNLPLRSEGCEEKPRIGAIQSVEISPSHLSVRPGPPRLRMFAPRFVLRDFDGGKNPEQSKRYLEVLGTALVDLNLIYLLSHPNTPLLYESGVRYVRDEPGQEDWQTIPEILSRRVADCKSLAAWRVAELLARKVRAFIQFHWRDSPQGATFHIYVQKQADGSLEDPSRILGMKRE